MYDNITASPDASTVELGRKGYSADLSDSSGSKVCSAGMITW